MINCGREEVKVVGLIKSQTNPKDFFAAMEGNKRSLTQMYKGQCSQIDSFKEKYFTNRLFTDTLIDCCQLETFQMENKVNALRNVIPQEYDRMKAYITLHYSLFMTYQFYATKLKEIMLEGWKDEKPKEMIKEHNEFVHERYTEGRV
jgi:hypothetical protein